MSMMSVAQQLHKDYITWPASAYLHNYVTNWTKGQELTKTWGDNGTQKEWEDEEFFTSRVKIKPYITNTATQIKAYANNKRLLFWVPVGDTNRNGVNTNSLPNGIFDSEVFSTWSYVDHYGVWTSPFGWVPGGFADAAHKHGTAVSGVASIPNAGISATWNTCLSSLAVSYKSDASKLGDFLAYHGVDGLGYNSEFSSGSTLISNLNQMHGKLTTYMRNTKGNTKFENPWYTGTNDNGSIDFTSALTSRNTGIFGTNAEPRTSLFVNYEWLSYKGTTDGQLISSGNTERAADLYMGMNMQAGCKRDNEWLSHETNPYSIGLWGAHDFNYLWVIRSAEGSADAVKQRTYQKHLEQWFTNGNRNPANTQAVFETRSLKPSDDWFGMSSFMAAKSTLGWDLDAEPFISFFNLGNGRFFNWKGERQNNNEWYNIGVQDYMPTWRWWWTSKFLSGNKADVPESGLASEFTWNDAYMGGSCLRIYGTNAEKEYLHLFKTQFTLKRNDVITVRYKLVNGSAKMRLALSTVGNESKEVVPTNALLNVFTETQEVDDEVWVEKQITVAGALATPLNNKELAMLALRFENAKDLELYIGEISIRRGSYTTPATPSVVRSKTLSNNYKGIDGKMVFKMANSKAAGEPVYNLDVNTSVFKIWSRPEGGEPTLMGMTSSWAAIVYGAPMNASGANGIQFGVQAVSTDFRSESEIAWSGTNSLPEYVTSEEVTLSKSTVTPGESFDISFVDANHAPSSWKLMDKSGNVVAQASGVTTFHVESLSAVGDYDLVVGEGTTAVTHVNFVSVSPLSCGRLPEITALTVNGDPVVSDGAPVSVSVATPLTLGYEGREADGTCSRGVNLNENLVGANVGELGLAGYKTFSVALWVKLTAIPKGISSLLTVENRNSTWPKNTWGYFWSRIAQDGTLCYNQIDGCWGGSLDANADGYRLYSDYKATKFNTGAWYHLVWVFEYNSNTQLRTAFYVNGEKQNITTWGRVYKNDRGSWDDLAKSIADGARTDASGTNSTETGFVSTSYPMTANDWISFGGGSTDANINCVNGIVDDFQIWDKAMTDEDVKASMAGLDPENLPEGVLAFWNFENAPASDHSFAAAGSKSGVKAYWYTREAQEGEGQQSVNPGNPEFTAGSPYISGESFKIETTPEWTARKGSLSEQTGNHTSGSAKLVYPAGREGNNYKVSLTLSNTYGSHTMDYPVFAVGDETQGIGDIAADGNSDFTATVETNVLFIDFTADGVYDVEVYNMAGMKVGGTRADVVAGQNACIALGAKGVYLVKVVRDGKLLRTVKVISK